MFGRIAAHLHVTAAPLDSKARHVSRTGKVSRSSVAPRPGRTTPEKPCLTLVHVLSGPSTKSVVASEGQSPPGRALKVPAMDLVDAPLSGRPGHSSLALAHIGYCWHSGYAMEIRKQTLIPAARAGDSIGPVAPPGTVAEVTD